MEVANSTEAHEGWAALVKDMQVFLTGRTLYTISLFHLQYYQVLESVRPVASLCWPDTLQLMQQQLTKQASYSDFSRMYPCNF
jgi:hypothetical protein